MISEKLILAAIVLVVVLFFMLIKSLSMAISRNKETVVRLESQVEELKRLLLLIGCPYRIDHNGADPPIEECMRSKQGGKS